MLFIGINTLFYFQYTIDYGLRKKLNGFLFHLPGSSRLIPFTHSSFPYPILGIQAQASQSKTCVTSVIRLLSPPYLRDFPGKSLTIPYQKAEQRGDCTIGQSAEFAQ